MATIARRIRETDFSDLHEPEMSEADWQDFRRGIALFNDGQFWDAHEAWEEIWKRHPESSRIFFQGLIQVAAGFHQLRRTIFHGVDKHLRNALWKLRPFQPHCLGINLKLFVHSVQDVHRDVAGLTSSNHNAMRTMALPKIEFLNATSS
ncbi:MAG: DUF309 domain-containing protein [Calditrichaeota bacterium]|nr:DUF309 domain-containing protein [Calditrichota bacterium]